MVAAGGSSHVRKVVCCATGNFRLLAWPRGEEVEGSLGSRHFRVLIEFLNIFKINIKRFEKISSQNIT